MRKLKWPGTKGRRSADGGDGGEFNPESMKVKWIDDKLNLTLPGYDGVVC